jgi:excisionase family DNA binding protein
MTLPTFNPLDVPAGEIPAALSTLAAWQSQLAARLMAPESAPVVTPEADRMLTVEEVAERLRCSTKKIYRLAPKVQWARKVGAGWLFSRNGLEKWLTRQRP